MTDWILILTYLVTQSPVLSDCIAFPEHKIECIHGAEVEVLGDQVTKRIVLNVYRGDAGRKECVDQAVRFADHVDPLPKDIALRIANGTPMTYICKEQPQ